MGSQGCPLRCPAARFRDMSRKLLVLPDTRAAPAYSSPHLSQLRGTQGVPLASSLRFDRSAAYAEHEGFSSPLPTFHTNKSHARCPVPAVCGHGGSRSLYMRVGACCAGFGCSGVWLSASAQAAPLTGPIAAAAARSVLKGGPGAMRPMRCRCAGGPCATAQAARSGKALARRCIVFDAALRAAPDSAQTMFYLVPSSAAHPPLLLPCTR